MLQEIVDFWRHLENSVHPEDFPVFERFPDHDFNLEFPPPAYIGDILNAPIIILENNGGFDVTMTPGEFPDASAHDEFRETLSSPRPLDLTARTVSPYYRSRNYTRYSVAELWNCGPCKWRGVSIDRWPIEQSRGADQDPPFSIVPSELASSGRSSAG